MWCGVVWCGAQYNLVQVTPDVLALYNIIETNFRPMSIVKDSMPHLETLSKAGGDLARSVSHHPVPNTITVPPTFCS